MAPLRMFFRGTAWPSVRAERLDASLASLFQPRGTVVPDVTYARLSARGRGRTWQASAAIGAWRDFAELDLANDAAIASFVAHFGDPAGVLQPGQDVVTQDWPALKTCLALIAQAWEPPGSDGISRVTKIRRGA